MKKRKNEITSASEVGKKRGEKEEEIKQNFFFDEKAARSALTKRGYVTKKEHISDINLIPEKERDEYIEETIFTYDGTSILHGFKLNEKGIKLIRIKKNMGQLELKFT